LQTNQWQTARLEAMRFGCVRQFKIHLKMNLKHFAVLDCPTVISDVGKTVRYFGFEGAEWPITSSMLF
jgi:hypothetical protein